MHMPDSKDRLSVWHVMSNYSNFKEWCGEFFVELFDNGFQLRFNAEDSNVGIHLLRTDGQTLGK